MSAPKSCIDKPASDFSRQTRCHKELPQWGSFSQSRSPFASAIFSIRRKSCIVRPQEFAQFSESGENRSHNHRGFARVWCTQVPRDSNVLNATTKQRIVSYYAVMFNASTTQESGIRAPGGIDSESQWKYQIP